MTHQTLSLGKYWELFRANLKRHQRVKEANRNPTHVAMCCLFTSESEHIIVTHPVDSRSSIFFLISSFPTTEKRKKG